MTHEMWGGGITLFSFTNDIKGEKKLVKHNATELSLAFKESTKINKQLQQSDINSFKNLKLKFLSIL